MQAAGFIGHITVKEELVLGGILLLGIVPGLVWAIRHDLREGESTITGMWTPPWKAIRRDENPAAFWQRIIYFCLGATAALVLGIYYVYDAFQRF